MAAVNPVDRVMDRVSRLHEVISDDIERLLRSDMSGRRYAAGDRILAALIVCAHLYTIGERDTRVWLLTRGWPQVQRFLSF